MKRATFVLGLMALVLTVFLPGCNVNNLIGYNQSWSGSHTVDQGEFEAATRFDPPEMGFLAGRYITEVILWAPDTCTINSCVVRFRNVDSSGKPGTLIREETHTLAPGCNSFELDTPYLLGVTTDIFVGVSVVNSSTQDVGAFLYDPGTNKSGYNYIYDSTVTGNPWTVFDNNWCINIIVRKK